MITKELIMYDTLPSRDSSEISDNIGNSTYCSVAETDR